MDYDRTPVTEEAPVDPSDGRFYTKEDFLAGQEDYEPPHGEDQPYVDMKEGGGAYTKDDFLDEDFDDLFVRFHYEEE